MIRNTRLLPVSSQFWHACAQAFAAENARPVSANFPSLSRDFSSMRVIVPTFEHAQLFLRALSDTLGAHFIPPRIMTMFAWIGMQPPSDIAVSANSERLMSLYGELRQHAWLKQLFGAKRNTDLLPLAQTLLGLSDELTQVWLPQAVQQAQVVEAVWLEALAQLPLPVQKLVSDETKLVWTLWQSQLDHHDKNFQEYAQMMQLAADASDPLVWISPTMPNAIEDAFLRAYAVRQSVQVISIDWRKAAIPEAMCSPWQGLLGDEAHDDASMVAPDFDWQRLRLCEVASLEEEAEQAAQCIVNWLQAGKQSIAVIAQDRVVSRRLRALLERAQVFVADETGWKLSTTRAAAALAAWFEVLTSRADTIALLDFLKSPFLMPEGAVEDKADLVMEIELALRRANVLGTWDAVLYALEDQVAARQWLVQIARLAHSYSGSVSSAKRSIKDWASLSLQTLSELGMQVLLQEDLAGQQLIQMLQALTSDCQGLASSFNFSEWRAFINMQLESTPFTLAHTDKRVVMLPLNGARLRSFDAVYLIGGDAKHLPSRAQETLFFTNAVRRECGLVTREQRQQQQLRDFAELILSNGDIVLSWQSQVNGEFNAVSPWIAQLALYLTRHGMPALANFKLPLSTHNLIADLHRQPRPSAAVLLPASLSASGLSSLIACPYQFFAGRMLKLSAIDELSDMPEKRDYGDWLHAILNVYHARLKDENIALSVDRVAILEEISNK
ncbi:MAG: PD-(D/E)XK nuclease family protein, partial [Undibacterium sp.]|nr:PD-(D/E)XK nuclease family protein [Undibacterium sp.]